jgi:argonaute-like protein implicated in RNA metabolism and viral defense
MARIYLKDGQFDHLQTASTRQGEKRAVQNLFPGSKFTGKKIVLHRYGRFQEKERQAFSDWGASIGALFYFVEIMRSATIPRIYDTADKGMKTPKGSICRLSETEALLVASQFLSDSLDTPQPIYIRTYPPFSLRYALHSVLSFTLLHYNEPAPGLPVTVYYGNKILRMANAVKSGAAVPFWL